MKKKKNRLSGIVRGGVFMATKKPSPDRAGAVNISGISNSTIVVGSSDTDAASGSGPTSSFRSEMQSEIMSVFDGLTRREQVQFMQNTYDYGDQCAEDRKKKKEK